jgi:membrane protein
VLDRLIAIGWVGRLDEGGAARHVLLAEPATQALQPLVQALLLGDHPVNVAVAQPLASLTLEQALGPAGGADPAA